MLVQRRQVETDFRKREEEKFAGLDVVVPQLVLSERLRDLDLRAVGCPICHGARVTMPGPKLMDCLRERSSRIRQS